jgi:hypothetical protein
MLNNTEMKEEKEIIYQYVRIIDGNVVNFVTPNVELAFARTHKDVVTYDK